MCCCDIVEQLFELCGLCGKNYMMVKYMLMCVQGEKEEFEQSIVKFQVLCMVFGCYSVEIIKSVQFKQICLIMCEVCEKMKECVFFCGLCDDMDKLFGYLIGFVCDVVNCID